MKHVWFDWDVERWKWILRTKSNSVQGHDDTQEGAERSADSWLEMYRERGML